MSRNRSASPLFDALVAQTPPRTGRPLTPVRPHRSVAGSTAPTWMTPSAPVASTSAVSVPTAIRPRREVQTALPSISTLAVEPISTKDLTADEREIIAEMGGTVARLLLQMMKDDDSTARR